jgi:predicted DNA-binding transcriptional regulator AlpA
MNMNSTLRALSISDAARAYSIGRSTLYLLLKQEKLRDVKVLGRRLVLVDDLERLISGEAAR